MKYRFYNRIFLIVLLVLCSFSCSSDLDTNQVNDFNIQPVITTNLAYFEAKAPEFVDNGIEQRFFSYQTNVEFFKKSFVQNDLVKAELYFRIKNTINRDFRFNIVFLNSSNGVVHQIPIDVDASNGTETLTEKTETFESANLSDLKNTTKLVFSIAMQSGPPLSESSPGRVELSSSLTAYFNVE